MTEEKKDPVKDLVRGPDKDLERDIYIDPNRHLDGEYSDPNEPAANAPNAKDPDANESVGKADEYRLRKLKKEELLKIMLAQGELIDAQKRRIESLEARLADKQLRVSKAGSLAEASLAVTKIFEEAEKAAQLYVYNIRKAAEEAEKKK